MLLSLLKCYNKKINNINKFLYIKSMYSCSSIRCNDNRNNNSNRISNDNRISNYNHNNSHNNSHSNDNHNNNDNSINNGIHNNNDNRISNDIRNNNDNRKSNNNNNSSLSSYFKYNLNKEIYTIPNMITMSRIISSPFLTYAIINDMKYTALIGCCIFGFTDWLDGYIAKNYNQMTVLGAFLDPVADKILIGALSIGLCYKGLIPLGLASVIIGRDLVLVAGSFIMRLREQPVGSPFFDTTYSATFEIAPSTLSKVNTGFQFLVLATTIGNFGLGIPTIAYIEPLWWITAVTTIGSGIGYLDGTGVRRLSESGVGRLGKNLNEYDTKDQ